MPKFAFLFDENIGVKTINLFSETGQDIKSVIKNLRGAKDKDILDIAFKEKRIIITLDKDFCDLVFRDSLPCHGIILLRLGKESSTAISNVLSRFLESNQEDLQGKFVVLIEIAARIREIK